jgi:hypothetical protein
VQTKLFINASNDFSSTELEILIQNTTLTQFISPWLLMVIYLGLIVIIAIAVQGLCSLNYKMKKKKIEKKEKEEKEKQKNEQASYKRTEVNYNPTMYVKAKTILLKDESDSQNKYLSVSDSSEARKRHSNVDSAIRFQNTFANDLTFFRKKNDEESTDHFKVDINHSSFCDTDEASNSFDLPRKRFDNGDDDLTKTAAFMPTKLNESIPEEKVE